MYTLYTGTHYKTQCCLQMTTGEMKHRPTYLSLRRSSWRVNSFRSVLQGHSCTPNSLECCTYVLVCEESQGPHQGRLCVLTGVAEMYSFSKLLYCASACWISSLNFSSCTYKKLFSNFYLLSEQNAMNYCNWWSSVMPPKLPWVKAPSRPSRIPCTCK
jgi:hypothetical protein